MKKFKFNLEKLLSYKNQVLEGEMQKLAVITANIHAAENEIARLKRESAKTGAELEEKLKGLISPRDCITYQNYLDKLRDNIKLEERRLAELNAEMERQIDVITEAKKESRSLEILKENKYEEYLKEDRKNTERDIEEFVSAQEALNKLNGDH